MRTDANNQRAGFTDVNEFDGGQVDRLILGFEIQRLAADQTQDADGARQFVDHAARRWPRATPGQLGIGKNVKRFGQEAVAGEQRHAFAKDFMRRRLAAPHVVVIERRQIVMDQGIGVDHLHRAGKRQNARRRGAKKLAGCQRQDRTDSFAAGKHAVAQRAKDGCRAAGIVLQVSSQSACR